MNLDFAERKNQVITDKYGEDHLCSLVTWKIIPLRMEFDDDVEEHYFLCYEHLNSLYHYIQSTCESKDRIRFLVESEKRVERGLWKQVKDLTPQYFANVFDAFFIEFNTSQSVRDELMDPSLELIVLRKTRYIKTLNDFDE